MTHVSTAPDHELVALALQDDQRAFRELERRYKEKVFSETFLMVKDWDQADSLTNTTFVRAFAGLDGYDPNRDFSAWLLRIAKNVALRRLEKRNPNVLHIEGSMMVDTGDAEKNNGLQVSAKGGNALHEVVARETDDEIRHALAQLKPAHREAVLLHIDEVPHAEIARRLGVPLKTAESYITRGRKKVRRLLGRSG